MDINLKKSKKAFKKYTKGKGDRAYKKKLINESIDGVTDYMKSTMPKYIRLKNGMIVNIHEMLT